MVSAMPLSQMFTGRRYTVVRDTMLSTNLAIRSANYLPLTFPAAAPRLFPVGNFIKFDIYNKYPYVVDDEKTTVQIRFNMWIPFGAFLVGKTPLSLLTVFYPIAERLFSRINVDASLEAMQEAQNVHFTVGIRSRTVTMLNNISTITISVTKVKPNNAYTYIYDFVVRYQYNIQDLGGEMYRVRLCNFKILRAISCRTGNNLYQFYRDTYFERYGAEITEEDYYNILDTCPFTWKLYTPLQTPLCRGFLNVNTLG